MQTPRDARPSAGPSGPGTRIRLLSSRGRIMSGESARDSDVCPISLIFDQSAARTGQATKPHWQNLRRPASREKPGKLFSRRDSGFHHAECGQARARYWRFKSGPRDHRGIPSQYLASFMHDLNSFYTLRISKWQSGVKPLFGAQAPGTCAAGSHVSEQASIPSQAWLGAPASRYPEAAR